MNSSAATDLVWARDTLLAPAQAGVRDPNRRSAESLREALTDLHDFWLASRAREAGIRGTDCGITLVAVGALGRCELVPYSDLDLAIIFRQPDGGARASAARHQEIERLAERLWYPLWDARIGLDHSVRTIPEATQVAAEDLRTAFGLLDARCLAGDTELFDQLVQTVRMKWRATARTRVDELAEQAHARWERSGEVASRVEPDLKHGRGGLRDLQILDALAAAQLVDRPGPEVRAARTLLLDVRTELHRQSGRAADVLHAQDGDEVAVALGLADRFALARELSGAGRTVGYAVDVALRATRNDGKGRFGLLRRGPVRRPLDDGVVLHGAEVVLARDAVPSRDPALLLRVAAAAARGRHPIAAGTLARLADSAPELRAPWPAEARGELVELLGAGDGLIDVVEALDRSGLWARLFPEWGAVRDLSPRESVHTWTVDRHLVHACAYASRLTTRVSRPDLLLLGALLHDIGKGREQDHSVVGAELAVHIGQRLGLPAADVRVLSAVVRHHLLLPHTATRRDVGDKTTVQRVVDTLEGDPVRLEILYALAEADARATAPPVWKDWRAALIGDLVRAVRLAMAGESLPAPEPVSGPLLELAESVAATGRPEVALDSSGRVATLTVLARQRPGLLALASGVLALNSLEVHAAELHTHRNSPDVFVGVFTVSPRFGSPPDASLLREQFARAVEGTLPLAQRLAGKERDYDRAVREMPPARVHWFDGEAGPKAALLELRAADRIGLLHRVAAALDDCEARVLWARAATLGGTAVDSFSLARDDGASDDPVWRQRVEHAVLRTTE